MEILASLNDVNSYLPNIDEDAVVEATDENSDLIQLSVARVIRGYLSTIVDTTELMSWDSPEDTPDIIREAASMLIASQVYFNFHARTRMTIEDRNFAQLLYDRAIAILEKIIEGLIEVPGIDPGATSAMSELDFFPVDDTDRAFTMSMEL